MRNWSSFAMPVIGGRVPVAAAGKACRQRKFGYNTPFLSGVLTGEWKMASNNSQKRPKNVSQNAGKPLPETACQTGCRETC
jgi:hypothetical protein